MVDLPLLVVEMEHPEVAFRVLTKVVVVASGGQVNSKAFVQLQYFFSCCKTNGNKFANVNESLPGR